jgi:hypothetical protein
MRAALQEPLTRAQWRERSTIIEPRLGQINQHDGFRRWTVWGLAGVKTQWSLRWAPLEFTDPLRALACKPPARNGQCGGSNPDPSKKITADRPIFESQHSSLGGSIGPKSCRRLPTALLSPGTRSPPRLKNLLRRTHSGRAGGSATSPRGGQRTARPDEISSRAWRLPAGARVEIPARRRRTVCSPAASALRRAGRSGRDTTRQSGRR